MSYLDINKLKERLAQLRAQIETLGREMEEIGTLIALADKYVSTQSEPSLKKASEKSFVVAST